MIRKLQCIAGVIRSLCAVVLFLVCGCQNVLLYEPDAAAYSRLSVQDARDTVLELAKVGRVYMRGGVVDALWDGEYMLLTIENYSVVRVSVAEEGLVDVMVRAGHLDARVDGTWVTSNGKSIIGFDGRHAEERAKRFADAWNRLASRGRQGNVDRSEDLAAFRRRAEDWRLEDPHPEISEEAKRCVDRGSNALKHRKMEVARDMFRSAIAIEPCWPALQWNQSLVCAELEEYSDAVFHMSCYLELLPGAADAEEAQSLIRTWEEILQDSR